MEGKGRCWYSQARLQFTDCQALAASLYQEPHDLESNGIAKFGETVSSSFDVHAPHIAHREGDYNYKTGFIVYTA